MFVEHLVTVFREVRRVLRDDGTCWIVLGDSYCSTAPGTAGDPLHRRGILAGVSERRAEASRKNRPDTPAGLKPKDLVGVPWRTAFALQADGWWLRSDIVWSKPNPLPESIQDRPTKSHEYVFLLSKSARYFYDAEAVKEPSSETSHGSPRVNPGVKANAGGFTSNGQGATSLGRWTPADRLHGRNRRSVWTIATSPFPGAHFATFPPKLVEPCIKAGVSEKGACPVCGAVWRRMVKTEQKGYRANGQRPAAEVRGVSPTSALRGNGRDAWTETRTTGWAPTCPKISDTRKPLHGPTYSRHRTSIPGGQSLKAGGEAVTVGWKGCDHDATPVPCLVLDPFSGSGTTGIVARSLGAHYIGIELNPEYAEMSRQRLRGTWVKPKRAVAEPSEPVEVEVEST
jgi:DNA modification methylase